MPELESTIEKKLINQLCYGDSQWTHRPDLRTEDALWQNFRHILEQNNKAKLDDIPLTDDEFQQVKNQIQFSSFYDAGKWLAGENGIVYVRVQRGNDILHLNVLNHQHVSGGTSVYEIINQYQALKEDGEDQLSERDRRFDVTLMINGLPLIHIELKNREHSYVEGFNQIKKYIAEGKFRGIFSAVQMFVVSNAVDTRYFSAARDTELNEKFVSSWLNEENKPVPFYLDFAKKVLRIPEAHEMVTKYTVLDKDAKRLLLLRPYQIHAIESMRAASRKGQSGYIWHTTGSGKTMTSYKATRNLLMDIPAIDKTVFLIDRKDLDNQTKMAFQSYADNDLVDVDETDNVIDLIRKLGNNDRQMIVTTIQKMQVMINRRLKETHSNYQKIKDLKIAFVVDECHRAVSPAAKKKLNDFFRESLWFGFTGTPRFPDNPYPQLGELPRTTDKLYGPCLHKYTIKEAIHDEAVLGFMNEYLIDSDIRADDDNVDPGMYERESHKLMVLNTILNKSNEKFGISNGKGKTYEAILTTSSIKQAQEYYDLLKKVVKGETPITINEEIRMVLPDFPKFAITYSVTENEENSVENQNKMKEALADYNALFGTHYGIDQIGAYNTNLNDRLARKMDRYKARKQQLDIVIVVDRLLTGFDAPCLSTLFMDRQPMQPHDIVQALSRTNRLFDKPKKYGQIVTFQSPKLFKESVDNALKLFSAGGIGDALAADWEETENGFIVALANLRALVPLPSKVPELSKKEKKRFAALFQRVDSLVTQLRAFTKFDGKSIEDYGITQDEYEDYNAHYHNVIDELRADRDDNDRPDDDLPVNFDYEPTSFAKVKIDYEYIISLIQDIVSSMDDEDSDDPEEFRAKVEEIQGYIDEYSKENPKLATMMLQILNDVKKNPVAFKGKNISEILSNMKRDAMQKVVDDFVRKWFVDRNAVAYAIENNHNGVIPNASVLKDSMRYSEYKENTEEPLKKPKARSQMVKELETIIQEEMIPLQIGVNY